MGTSRLLVCVDKKNRMPSLYFAKKILNNTYNQNKIINSVPTK